MEAIREIAELTFIHPTKGVTKQMTGYLEPQQGAANQFEWTLIDMSEPAFRELFDALEQICSQGNTLTVTCPQIERQRITGFSQHAALIHGVDQGAGKLAIEFAD